MVKYSLPGDIETNKMYRMLLTSKQDVIPAFSLFLLTQRLCIVAWNQSQNQYSDFLSCPLLPYKTWAITPWKTGLNFTNRPKLRS